MNLRNSLKKITNSIIIFILIYSILFNFLISIENTDAERTDESIRTNVDVGIEKVFDVTAQTYPEHYPWMPIKINSTVGEFLNNPISQSFEVLFTIDDNVDDVPGYHYQSNQTIIPTQLSAGGTVDLFWNWTPPLNAPPGSSWNYSNGHHNFTAIITTVYDGDINSSNNQMKLNLTIFDPDFQTDLYSGWNGIPEPIKTIDLYNYDVNQSTFNFTVFNYKKETWVDFKVIVPKNWTSTTPMSIFMIPNSNTSKDNLSFIVFPSNNRDDIPTQTEIPIYLLAYSRRYPINPENLTFKVKISFIPYPLIFPPNTTSREPGEQYVDIIVTNDGNGQDSFVSEASVGQNQAENDFYINRGWNAEVYAGKYSKILARGENHILTVKITIPSTVPAGAPCLINLTVNSEKAEFACPNHPYASQSAYVTMYSGAYSNVDIQDNISYVSMAPDSVQTISFSIINTGNKLDKNITVNVTSVPDGWTTTLDTSDIPFTGLGRQAEADIKLTIQTPKEVEKNKYSIKVAAFSKGEIKDESIIEIFINSTHNIKLYSEFDLLNIIPGQDNPFNITIQNLGNSISNFVLTHSCSPLNSGLEKYVKFEYTTILLGPYIEMELTLNLNVPTNFSIDSNLNTSQVDDYILQIDINDEIFIDNEDSVTLDIHIDKFQDFTLTKNELIGYVVRNSNAGTSLTTKIQNLGNYQDEVEFNMEPPHISDPPWVIIPYKLSLPYNNIENFSIDIEPKSIESRVGTYIFIINCSSVQNPLIFKYLQIIVKIIDYDLEISELVVDGRTPKLLKTYEGTKLKFSFDLCLEFTELDITKYLLPPKLDFRNLPVTIKIFDNDIEVINGSIVVRFMNGTTNQKISLYWFAESIGLHKIKIVIDPANEIPENYENNNIKEIYVQVVLPTISEDTGDNYGIVFTAESGMITLSVLILLIAGAFVGGTEIGKFKLLIGLLPLYTRLNKDKILDHETRGMIRGYIIANPGVHFNYLKRELKLKNGSLAYHLKVLEQAEFVKIEREGMYTRLYPMKNGAYYKGAFNGVRLSELQKKIVRQIRIKPGITQKKIIERTNIKQQTVSRNISALEKKEVIRVKRKGRETCCYFNKEIEIKDT
jgi:predicted transcriptional regulator/uncharacterized membrane protein